MLVTQTIYTFSIYNLSIDNGINLNPGYLGDICSLQSFKSIQL